jgi:hypothetical protein
MVMLRLLIVVQFSLGLMPEAVTKTSRYVADRTNPTTELRLAFAKPIRIVHVDDECAIINAKELHSTNLLFPVTNYDQK